MKNNKVKLQGSYRHSTLAMIFYATLFMTTGAWANDTGDAEVVSINVTKIEIENNGSKYTNSVGNQNLKITGALNLDAGFSGRVKSWKVTPNLSIPPAAATTYPEYAISKVYKLVERPKRVKTRLDFTIASNKLGIFAALACNQKAEELRKSGKDNAWIFSNDQSIDAHVNLGLEYDMSGISGTEVPTEIHSPITFKILCKKQPPRAPSKPNPSRDIPDVKKATLTILESATLGGDCRLKLSGVLETSAPNMEAQFQYEDDKGKKSDMKTVKSDHTSTVMFSHEYALPGTGLKTGKIRILGKAGKFKSAWMNYSVNCMVNAPNNMAADVPPDVEMKVTVATYKNVNGHNCIDKLWLTGIITGKGSQSGRARFTGSSFLSPYKDYTVTNGTKATILMTYTFNWGIVPLDGFVAKQQSFKFNVENDNKKVIASTPLKNFNYTCGKINAGVVPGAIPKTPVKVNPIGTTGPNTLKR